jgi:hypothetical protein
MFIRWIQKFILKLRFKWRFPKFSESKESENSELEKLYCAKKNELTFHGSTSKCVSELRYFLITFKYLYIFDKIPKNIFFSKTHILLSYRFITIIFETKFFNSKIFFARFDCNKWKAQLVCYRLFSTFLDTFSINIVEFQC